MHYIFVLMGKSASGKDTIYERLLKDEELGLRKVIPYTTRPIREGEAEGQEYHFTSREAFERLRDEGRLIEYREYQTVYGPWDYFTVDDGQIDLAAGDALMIGTLEMYVYVRDYYSAKGLRDRVIPLYVYVEDGERLLRAIHREQRESAPRYEELCRRFLADQKDFSEENLCGAGVTARYENKDLETCLAAIRERILECRNGAVCHGPI